MLLERYDKYKDVSSSITGKFCTADQMQQVCSKSRIITAQAITQTRFSSINIYTSHCLGKAANTIKDWSHPVSPYSPCSCLAEGTEPWERCTPGSGTAFRPFSPNTCCLTHKVAPKFAFCSSHERLGVRQNQVPLLVTLQNVINKIWQGFDSWLCNQSGLLFAMSTEREILLVLEKAFRCWAEAKPMRVFFPMWLWTLKVAANGLAAVKGKEAAIANVAKPKSLEGLRFLLQNYV